VSDARLTYAVVTPARNEAANLPRLAACLAAQTRPPDEWVIVDNGSDDGTADVVSELAEALPWVRRAGSAGGAEPTRGGPVTRAFHAGLETLCDVPDVVVKLDADISFEADHFERLLGEFAAEPELGIASGSCFEQDAAGMWRQKFGTSDSVWGAARGYRRACLEDVLPLDAHIGWDGIDVFKATSRGWRTKTLLDLPFRHHRPEGERDGRRRTAWFARGRSAHYMSYRPSYLVVRSFYNAVRRDPAALALLAGYVAAAIAREPRCGDTLVRDRLRDEQRLANLLFRAREALGRGPAPSHGGGDRSR
jgi:glycosyltransferase involved in cell wall biosynthesis